MDNIVRGGNWYFDTLNAWRVLDEVELPELTFEGDEFAPGGHMMGVDFPETLKALKATIKLRNDDPRVRSLCGRQPGDYINATWYENLASFRNGEEKGRVIILKGLVNVVKADTRKGLKAAGTSYDFSTVVFYHDMVDGQTVHKFDFFSGPAATIIGGRQIFGNMAGNLAIAGGTAL